MSDQVSDGIKYTMPDGRSGRLAIHQVEMISKRPDGHHGAIHTVSGEVIPIINVATVLTQWRALAAAPR